MYADTHDRPGLDEQYIMATNASDLTVDPDRTTAADHLIAAGLVGNRMGSILIHLIGEWTAADKPPRPSEYDIALRAELLWCALGVGHKKRPDLKRTRAELMNAHARAMRAVYFSLPSRMDALAIMADWARWKGVDVDLLSPALYRHLDPACPVCEGRGKMVMADAPVLGKECHACGGTGIYPQALGAHRIRDWLKDSAATAILALETQPRESLRFVFADTGNEHESTYEYIAYMGEHLGIQIDTIRANFEADMERKRRYILEKWPGKGVSDADCERAASFMVPTGIPYLDLCMMKGRFPGTKSAFCTQEIKTMPLMEYQLAFIERGEADAVWSWQGVRLDESASRKKRLQGTGACVKAFEVVGGGIYNHRPILRWKAADVFEAADLYGLKPNPLYLQGMTRVGCMPCINAGKDEVLEISKRFPAHIARIAEWERLVGLTSKRMEASFFPDPDRDAHLDKRGIYKVVEWSKTKRGGQLMDWIRIHEEAKACESAYGLCE